MANEVLNKIGQQQARRQSDCRVISVNWGPWDGGMVTPSLKTLFQSEGVGLIEPASGGQFLINEICQESDHAIEVVALAGNLPEPTKQAITCAPVIPKLAPALPIAFERDVNLDECPVLRSHVIDGHAVLPMALIAEWFAHAALVHNPGLSFLGWDDLRILHGVVLDGSSLRLQIGAGKAQRIDGVSRVPVELRSKKRDGREILHARADVILAGSLAMAPSAKLPLPTGAYSLALADAYRQRLFHGIDLQGIERIDGCDARGIACTAQAAPAPAKWLTTPLRPHWLTDPLVLDAAYQLMILWTFEEHGLGSLPCAALLYRQYRRSFPADGCRIVIEVTRSNALAAQANIEFVDTNGSLVARLEGYECTLDAALQERFRRNSVRITEPEALAKSI